jgi:hypothetical protein
MKVTKHNIEGFVRVTGTPGEFAAKFPNMGNIGSLKLADPDGTITIEMLREWAASFVKVPE